MLIHFKNLKHFFSFRRWMFFWYQHYKGMFFVGFLIVLGFGGYFWYNNLYQYHWSDERKREFIATHFKATVFKEKSFEQLVADLKERSRRSQTSVLLSRDLFSGQLLP